MADRIHIKDLLLRTIIGVNEEERRARQDVLINVVLFADTRPAGESDVIADAVNYRTITKNIIRLVEESGFYLVEKLAAEIAAVCLEESRVEGVDVRVEKPGALRFARSVGVEIHRTRADVGGPPNRAFISLGSNIEPERNLPAAVRLLAKRCTVVAKSPVYETVPVGTLDQPNFLNAAVLIATDLTAAELKASVLDVIEDELGRVRTEDKNAPRTIDLDILMFDADVMDLGGRHVPDPDSLRYAHVAVPLSDIAPRYRHPETGQTVQEIVRCLPDRQIARRLDVLL